ncbi:unnamed protein product [Owenia fusiformis]|uniref:Uncharacterized protein n=1 Tax=Owenia fusiformis TaxID=6347 RepID=A0A8J1TT25_OWEFU|nr:unnamed protein product [Owenia fusiformis]
MFMEIHKNFVVFLISLAFLIRSTDSESTNTSHSTNSSWLEDETKDTSSICVSERPMMSLYNETGNGTCYWYSPMLNMTWRDANDFCIKHTATMVRSLSKDGIDILSNIENHSMTFWLGMKLIEAKEWLWLGGAQVHDTVWDVSTNQPDGEGTHICAVSNGSLWDDTYCNDLNNVMCEFTVENRQCPFGWHGYASDCYYPSFGVATSYDAAVEACEEMSASLVNINDADENSFVTAISYKATGDKYYIGVRLVRSNNITHYQWQNSSKVTYTKWIGEGSGGGDCAAVTGDGWVKEPCTSSHKYMCKRRKAYEDSADLGPPVIIRVKPIIWPVEEAEDAVIYSMPSLFVAFLILISVPLIDLVSVCRYLACGERKEVRSNKVSSLRNQRQGWQHDNVGTNHTLDTKKIHKETPRETKIEKIKTFSSIDTISSRSDLESLSEKTASVTRVNYKKKKCLPKTQTKLKVKQKISWVEV